MLKHHYDEYNDNEDNKKRIQKQPVFKERRNKQIIFNHSSLLHIRLLNGIEEDNINRSFQKDLQRNFYSIIQGNNKPTAILVYFLMHFLSKTKTSL